MSDLIARLHITATSAGMAGVPIDWIRDVREAIDRIESLEAQLSALRDQQPVAWTVETPYWRQVVFIPPPNEESGVTIRALVYAHPSCVSPDKPQQQQQQGE